tara:strand:+ start:595 stop:936 length:342 start_codon:yes stop_codon:yes gene_type:complete
MKKILLLLLFINSYLYSQNNYQTIPLVNSYPIYSGDYINYGNYNYNYNTNLYGTISNKIEASNDYDAYLKYEYQYKYNYNYDYIYDNYNTKVGQGVIKNFNGEYYIINLYKKY